jgi:UDP-N-acetylglucosamine acyltransferase
MRQIHSSAIVDPRAELADDVAVGAFSIIRAGVVIGPGTQVFEASHIHEGTTIGRNCKIGPAAFVGLPPQHTKLDGKGTRAIIGDDVVIREMASVHRSINPAPDHATRIGNRCMLMANSHVAHDCELGEDVILANGVLLGGHCVIGNRAFIGGGTGIHQFTRVGRLAMIAGNEPISHDVPPFAAARYWGLKGYNAIGCKRAGMSRETIHAVRGAFRCLHTNRTMPAAIAAIRATIPILPEIKELLDFLCSTKRGILSSVKGRGICKVRQAPEMTSDSNEE